MGSLVRQASLIHSSKPRPFLGVQLCWAHNGFGTKLPYVSIHPFFSQCLRDPQVPCCERRGLQPSKQSVNPQNHGLHVSMWESTVLKHWICVS